MSKRPKIVVFKARFRNPSPFVYDQLHAPACEVHGVDFVLFADIPRETTSRGWRCLPQRYADENHARRARHHKVMAHELFPDADYTLLLDGTYQPTTDLFKMVEQFGDRDFALHLHPTRDCVYAEGARIVQLRKDVPERVEKQLARYRGAAFPEKMGLHATDAVLRRHSPEVKAFEKRWWDEVDGGSYRDHMAFEYCLQTSNPALRVHQLPGWRMTSTLFKYRPHGATT